MNDAEILRRVKVDLAVGLISSDDVHKYLNALVRIIEKDDKK